MSVEFDTPANRIISEFAPKSRFVLDTTLPDLTFLRQLSVQGRLRYDFIDLSATGSITITPPTGETYFLYRILLNVAMAGRWGLTVVNDGITRSIQRINNPAADESTQFEYDIFDSLVGNGTKSLVITANEVAGTAATTLTIFGWVENTSRIRDVAT